MTLFASYAGRRIVSGIVSIPYYGAWAADMVLAEGDAVATGGDLVIGPLTLARAGLGRSGSLGGSRGLALVGEEGRGILRNAVLNRPVPRESRREPGLIFFRRPRRGGPLGPSARCSRTR